MVGVRPQVRGGRGTQEPTRAARQSKLGCQHAQLIAWPASGLPRLSSRRAARALKERIGTTLHKLRHSALTHLAEAGASTCLAAGKSRHGSMRSLERYVNPSATAIVAMTARHDPNRRRR